MSLRSFLAGASDQLLEVLATLANNQPAMCAFQQAMQNDDLENLRAFYCLGPKRNYDLATKHNLQAQLIQGNKLDDLLAATRD